MLTNVRRALAWTGSSSGVVLTAILIVVGGTWAFVSLADEVTEGETQQFDERVVKALRRPNPEPSPAVQPDLPLGPKWLHEMGRDITGLGGIAVLALLIVAVAGYLLLINKKHAMVFVLISTIGALVISLLLKNAFDRDRPDVSHYSHVHTSSFPSGHSMMSAAVYLTLGSLLARLHPSRIVKFYFLAVAILITGLVGLSRIYMGVHYPTDVLAGWTAGLVWALLCWLVARYLQRRGTVERDNEESVGVSGYRSVGVQNS